MCVFVNVSVSERREEERGEREKESKERKKEGRDTQAMTRKITCGRLKNAIQFAASICLSGPYEAPSIGILKIKFYN